MEKNTEVVQGRRRVLVEEIQSDEDNAREVVSESCWLVFFLRLPKCDLLRFLDNGNRRIIVALLVHVMAVVVCNFVLDAGVKKIEN